MSKQLKLTILLVEDDKSVAAVVAYNLQKGGYTVHVLHDGEGAVEWAKSFKPDLILLDWVLPGKSGMEICAELRAFHLTANTPIIMLSAKDQDFDKVAGLEEGADDYIVKPFSPVELMSRVKAILRRIRPAFAQNILSFYDIEMNLSSYSVTRGERNVKLAPIEFKILQIMLEQPEVVLGRSVLIEKIWGADIKVDPRTVDVHITRLRKALLNASADDIDVIKTVRLAGYKLQLPKKGALLLNQVRASDD
ncbi:MAG: response regulator [Proteobacteria bacterium]|nr:response regulator [Pseudomonadota bacterium]